MTAISFGVELHNATAQDIGCATLTTPNGRDFGIFKIGSLSVYVSRDEAGRDLCQAVMAAALELAKWAVTP